MLSKVITIKKDYRAVVKKTPIKVTQKDIDELNKKIRKDISENKIRNIKTQEIAEEEIMR